MFFQYIHISLYGCIIYLSSPLFMDMWGCFWRRRRWHPTPVLLPGKSLEWRSLVGCSPWGRYELGMTEQLHFPFSLACIGEGNGNPLLCSCLENPRDRRIWWAAVCGVTQSRTRLKRLSSSSSSRVVSGFGGLLSMGLHRVGHDWSDLAATAAAGLFLIF